MNPESWNEGVAEVCDHFQMDLSSLVDGELDEAAASRAMLHLEACEACREFFDETRHCLRLHRDMADPDRLVARVVTLTGGDIADAARGFELVHRLASIFYQLGKAYVLASLDIDHRTRVFEEAVPVEPTQTQGRGFVDGVLLSGAESAGGVDWQGARGLLNGRLKTIESPREKGRKLLLEALEADPSHEEARIYLAFLAAEEGRTLQAAEEYRNVFRTAIDERNRGHAAVQLGRLHAAEGNHRRALACFRWVRISGLARREERFFFVDFNIGVQRACLGDRRASLNSFRALIDRNPGRLTEIVHLFAQSKGLRAAIEAQAGFAEDLLGTCPELFGGAGPQNPSPKPDPRGGKRGSHE
jgi:tetratricopeptide (TPR) repeat protein